MPEFHVIQPLREVSLNQWAMFSLLNRHNMIVRLKVCFRDLHRKPQKIFKWDALFLQRRHRITGPWDRISRIRSESSGHRIPFHSNFLRLCVEQDFSVSATVIVSLVSRKQVCE